MEKTFVDLLARGWCSELGVSSREDGEVGREMRRKWDSKEERRIFLWRYP
jgi:hypothetical protein